MAFRYLYYRYPRNFGVLTPKNTHLEGLYSDYVIAISHQKCLFFHPKTHLCGAFTVCLSHMVVHCELVDHYLSLQYIVFCPPDSNVIYGSVISVSWPGEDMRTQAAQRGSPAITTRFSFFFSQDNFLYLYYYQMPTSPTPNESQKPDL